MKKVRMVAFVVFVLCLNAKIVFASETSPFIFEGEYILGSGCVSDGEFLWTIPYEKESFSKINISTGKKEDLFNYTNYEELQELSGYLSGAIQINTEFEKFLYLAPYDVDKPLVRINLENMKIEYPFRNVGFYFGSCQITNEGGADFLWLFPSSQTHAGNGAQTEIVKLNLTKGKKEESIEAKIENKYYTFTDTIRVDDDIWLLPAVEGQPLIKMDTKSTRGSLESEGAKKIYSGGKMTFSRITTGVNDGKSLWFVGEDISFIFNESLLFRCDQEGNLISKITLTKDKYTEAVAGKGEIYLFAGAEGKKPVGTKIDVETSRLASFEISEKKGFIPAGAFAVDEGTSGIYLIPQTTNSKKMPLLKLYERPKLEIDYDTDIKNYRDFGDMSKGGEINIEFTAPNGFIPSRIYWYAKEEGAVSSDGKNTFEEYMTNYENSTSERKNCEKIQSVNEITILANRNAIYNYMIEFSIDDNENKLYAMCGLKVDNIYDRLPIKITRFNIEAWDEGSIIESNTRLKDFGAAFDFEGESFIKTDAPMELVPAKEVYANNLQWELDSPSSYVINLSDGTITPNEFFVEMEFAYHLKNSEPFDENAPSGDKEKKQIKYEDNKNATRIDEESKQILFNEYSEEEKQAFYRMLQAYLSDSDINISSDEVTRLFGENGTHSVEASE